VHTELTHACTEVAKARKKNLNLPPMNFFFLFFFFFSFCFLFRFSVSVSVTFLLLRPLSALSALRNHGMAASGVAVIPRASQNEFTVAETRNPKCRTLALLLMRAWSRVDERFERTTDASKLRFFSLVSQSRAKSTHRVLKKNQSRQRH
jgi:hypothetical protein